MTISSSARTAGPFTGTGAIVPYPFTFKVFTAADLLAYEVDASGNVTTLALSTNYTVVLNADQNSSPGGTLTLLVALPVGYTLIFTSNIAITQPVSLTNAGGFYPRTIEDELDRLTILIQQQAVLGAQALRVPDVAGVPPLGTAVSRANRLLGFDSAGNPVATLPTAGDATSLALDLANASNAAKGAGQIGFLSSLAYAAGTVGYYLKNLAFNFIAAGAGAVTRTAQDKMRDVVHIADFGAVPGASAAVNNAAIQQAINTALASARATLDLGASGDYAVTGLTIPASSQSLIVRGRGARLVTTTAAPIFTVTTSDDVMFDGVRLLGNSGGVINAQAGIYLNGIGRGRVKNCHIENFSTGINANNANLGYLTGGFQIPTEISGNVIKACYNGIYTEDQSAGSYGEYCRISNNTITDCLNWGINSHAGNTAIVANTVNGNYGGILIYSSGTVNGDHGMVVGNTINHNLRCGLFVSNILRSLIVANNNMWASLGDGTANGNLGTFNLASSFGAYFLNCQNLTVIGNVFGRNKINSTVDGFVTSVYAHNIHLTDPANTVKQFQDLSTGVSGPRGNHNGPNVFNGTWTGGGTNGDPNGLIPVTAFLNGWVNFAGVYQTAGYWKDENNVVHLTGLIKSGTLGLAAFNLPVEFRPIGGTLQFPCVANGAFGFVGISTAGDVTCSGSNANLSLDGISFLAV